MGCCGIEVFGLAFGDGDCTSRDPSCGFRVEVRRCVVAWLFEWFLQVAKGWALGSVLAALVGKTSEGAEMVMSGRLAQQLKGLSDTLRDHEVAILARTWPMMMMVIRCVG